MVNLTPLVDFINAIVTNLADPLINLVVFGITIGIVVYIGMWIKKLLGGSMK